MQDHRLGPETVEGRQHHPVHQQGHAAVVEARRHRQVDRPAAAVAIVARAATGMGPAPAFVDRDRQHPPLAGHRILDAVAVVGVDIDIGDPVEPAIEQRQYAEHRVVQVTEAARPVGPAVMGAAGRAVHDGGAILQHGRRGQGRAAGRRRAAEHLAMDRVALGAEVVAAADFGVAPLRRLGPSQSFDIGRVVEARQLRRRRHRAVDIDSVGQPAEGTAEVDHRRYPRDRQRVLAAVGRAPVDLAADEPRAPLPKRPVGLIVRPTPGGSRIARLRGSRLGTTPRT